MRKLNQTNVGVDLGAAAGVGADVLKRDLVGVGGVGTFLVNPCPLCTSLIKTNVDVDNVLNHVADINGVGVVV